MGDFVRHFSEFDKSYRCVYFAINQEFVENLALSLGIDYMPYAVMIGRGEVWACFDEAVRHPQVGYIRIIYLGTMH